MILVINPHGVIQCIYSEAIDLQLLGQSRIARASHVEPDQNGQWWADLAPIQGPRLGAFALRSQALEAEKQRLEASLLGVGLESN
jgi:hypothetical protein